jgi:hypothetical protein
MVVTKRQCPSPALMEMQAKLNGCYETIGVAGELRNTACVYTQAVHGPRAALAKLSQDATQENIEHYGLARA